MNIAGIYEYEIPRHVNIEHLVKRIIPHQPQLTLHYFKPAARGLCKLLPGLSQPAGYLRSHTYKQQYTILTIITVEHT